MFILQRPGEKDTKDCERGSFQCWKKLPKAFRNGYDSIDATNGKRLQGVPRFSTDESVSLVPALKRGERIGIYQKSGRQKEMQQSTARRLGDHSVSTTPAKL